MILQLRGLARLQAAEDVRREITQPVGAASVHVAPFLNSGPQQLRRGRCQRFSRATGAPKPTFLPGVG